MNAIVLPLNRGLIVSCQALEHEPLHGPHFMAAMARSAEQGGAVGIRANTPVDIAAIRQVTQLPIIGLYKISYPDSPVYITPTCAAAQAIAQAGCDVIALDATLQPRPGGETLAEIVRFIHEALGKAVMADISSLEEALAAQELGVDYVGSTLAGYTETGRPMTDGPDLELLAQLIEHVRVPVIAEGRYHEPRQVAQALDMGAFAVVVGGAITRPEEITRRFVSAIRLNA